MDFGNILAYTLSASVQIFLSVMTYAIFFRVILSWFLMPDSPILSFFIIVTEPVILPFRFLLVKFNLLQDSPLDFSTVVASLSLMLLSYLLPTITL